MQKKKLYRVGTNAPEFRRAIQVMDVLPNPKARTKAYIVIRRAHHIYRRLSTRDWNQGSNNQWIILSNVKQTSLGSCELLLFYFYFHCFPFLKQNAVQKSDMAAALKG